MLATELGAEIHLSRCHMNSVPLWSVAQRGNRQFSLIVKVVVWEFKTGELTLPQCQWDQMAQGMCSLVNTRKSRDMWSVGASPLIHTESLWIKVTLIFMYICMCVHIMCVQVCVCTCVHMHMPVHACAFGGVRWASAVASLKPATVNSLRQPPSLAWYLPIRLNWLAAQTPGSTWIHRYNTGITHATTMPNFSF